MWLPLCAGGCPFKRLSAARQCVAFRDDPASYVLALHARIGEGRLSGDAEAVRADGPTTTDAA